MPAKKGVHPAYRDKPEAVPSHAERASFYGGATKEAMNDRGRSVADLDRKGTGSVSGRAILETTASTRGDLDKAQKRKVAGYATRAGEEGDIATGRKKEKK